MDQRHIDNLPINGGRWSSFALLTPGVVSNSAGFGLLSFRGQSELLNNNTVDGADNNQAYFSEERGRTRLQYSSFEEALQEFQVNTSNYSSEYGRSAGGVINTVTKSNTNSLHGQAFFRDRDNDWGAFTPNTFLSLQTGPGGSFVQMPYKPKDWRKQWGFGVGGPLIRNRLFWFYAYDQSKRNFPGLARAGSANQFFATPVSRPGLRLLRLLGVVSQGHRERRGQCAGLSLPGQRRRMHDSIQPCAPHLCTGCCPQNAGRRGPEQRVAGQTCREQGIRRSISPSSTDQPNFGSVQTTNSNYIYSPRQVQIGALQLLRNLRTNPVVISTGAVARKRDRRSGEICFSRAS